MGSITIVCFQKNKVKRKRGERGERERERMSERESGNAVSVIHCRPSVIFLNTEAQSGPLPAPREASEAASSDCQRKVSKLIVCLVTAQSANFAFGNYFITEDEFCLETLTSSFVMEATSGPGEDQCAKQLNLRTRKRLSPVYTDENLPSKRKRRRKFSDCSNSSTSTVTQEQPTGSPQE